MSNSTPATPDPFQNPHVGQPENPEQDDPGSRPDTPTEPEQSTEEESEDDYPGQNGSGHA
jgi:hypothetical protein